MVAPRSAISWTVNGFEREADQYNAAEIVQVLRLVSKSTALITQVVKGQHKAAGYNNMNQGGAALPRGIWA